MPIIDRRHFLAGIAVAGLSVTCTGICSVYTSMDERMQALRLAMSDYEAASLSRARFYARCEQAGALENDGFWDWFVKQPVIRNYHAAGQRAQEAAEAAFATTPLSMGDEDAVVEALDIYAQIAPSAFALQTARDLFTPKRFQTYPLDNLRNALLTDPDEMFEKSGMPGFLKVMRQDRTKMSLVSGAS
jgi:hypothetical protein